MPFPRILLALVLAVAGCARTETDARPAHPGAKDSRISLPTGSATGKAGSSAAPDPAREVERGNLDLAYQWSQGRIGGAGWVTGLATSSGGGGRIYARTDVGGAYRWYGDSQEWKQMIRADRVPGALGSDYVVESIAVSHSDPDTVYLATGDDAPPGNGELSRTGWILVSRDGGASWVRSRRPFHISGNGAFRQRSERLAVSPTDPNLVLFGSRREGLWRSSDGGLNWEQVPESEVPAGVQRSEEASPGISFVSFDPEDASVAYAGVSGDSVYRSSNGGQSWTSVGPQLAEEFGAFEGTVVDGLLFVSMNGLDGAAVGSLQRYDPERGRWSDITPESDRTEWSVAVQPTQPDHLIAMDSSGSNGSVWRSTNGGRTWTQPEISTRSPDIGWIDASDIFTWLSVGRVLFDPVDPDQIWFAEGMGVWTARSVFSGDQLELVVTSRGIEESIVSDLLAVGTSSPVSAIADRQGFLHENLDQYPRLPLVDDTFAGGTDVDYSGGDPTVVAWVGAEYQRYWDDKRESRGAISRDGGASFSRFENLSPQQFGGNIAVSAGDADNLVWQPSYYLSAWEYTDKPKSTFVTTDGGINWTELPDVGGYRRYHRLMWWFTRTALAADRFEPHTFYLYDDEQHFLRSTDGGMNWEERPFSPPCTEANECHIFGEIAGSPTEPGELWASAGTAGLFHSGDAGATPWIRSPGIESVVAYGFGAAVEQSGPAVIYLYGRQTGDQANGYFRSIDDGLTWELIGRHPLGNYLNVTSITGDLRIPGRVYVGTSGGGFLYGDPVGSDAR